MMTKKAQELQAGDVVRIEYGDYGNMVDFVVDKAEPYGDGDRMIVSCHTDRIHTGFVMDRTEETEIVKQEAG